MKRAAAIDALPAASQHLSARFSLNAFKSLHGRGAASQRSVPAWPRHLRLALASAASLAAASASLAQPGAELPRDVQAQMVQSLWLDTCARHFANPEALRDTAKALKLQQDPPYAAKLLRGQPGTVWDASLGSQAQFSLLQTKDVCTVVARRASNAPVVATFEKVVQGIDQPNVTVERIVDRDIEEGGHTFRQVAYFVAKHGERSGWAFIATVSEDADVPLQVKLSIGRSKKP